jgi:large subunit ribosomal protein L1
MSQHGKKYRDARGQVDRERTYSPVEALGILKNWEDAKFDETVEAHFRLGLNVRHAEQQLRGTLMLPHGTGKEVRVAVFAEGEKAKEAETAGADVVGAADLATTIEDGFDDFDVAIATPDMMGVVGKLGRILGPRGKMPNPKTGTVTFDIGKAVGDAKGGKLEYRTDRGANVHVSIGKKSFELRRLVENYAAVVDEIVRARPSAAKGRYIETITVTTTMGPGIHIDPSKTRDIAEELHARKTSRGGVESSARQRSLRPASARVESFSGGARCREVKRNGSSESSPSAFRRPTRSSSPTIAA